MIYRHDLYLIRVCSLIILFFIYTAQTTFYVTGDECLNCRLVAHNIIEMHLLIVGVLCSKYKNLPVLVSGIRVRGSISASKQVRSAGILWTGRQKSNQNHISL